MLYKSFIHCIASISFCMIIIDEVYYRLKRYDERKKRVFEKPVEFIEDLFQTVEPFNIKDYVESPVDIFNEPTELGYNN